MTLSPYSITVPQTHVAVDATARATGQFSVDVKNVQAVLDRVVLEVDSETPPPSPPNPPVDPADPAWFGVDRHQRPIPAGGSEQYLVAVTVPATSPPGTYLMRPIVYSADRPPDDTKVTGPVMTLVVPAPPVPPLRPWWKRWWPWWLVAAVVAVLLVVAVVVVVQALSGGSKVAVPDERGKSLTVAQNDLQVHHLAAGTVTQQVETSVAKGTVVSQDPLAGATVATNSSVALTVADNVPIPGVFEIPVAAATAKLHALGLSVTYVDRISVFSGLALDTSPPEGTLVAPHSNVTIFVGVQAIPLP